MADEKLNTGPAENTSPEAAGPITTPEQAAASEPRQEHTGPTIPEPGDVVVSFDKINELMAEKRQNARAEVEKAETPETPEAAAPGETPQPANTEEPKKPRRGRPPKAEKAATENQKAEKSAGARKGRPPKADKTAPDKPKPSKRDKVSRSDGKAPDAKEPVKPTQDTSPKETATAEQTTPEPTTPPRPVEEGKLVYLKLSEVHPFHTFRPHPFKVRDDAKMQEIVASIRVNGIMVPGLARPEKDGNGYEIVAGHRRTHGSELAGLDEMPFIVREMTDHEAVQAMKDSNKQRDGMLPSELAALLELEVEDIKHQGGRLKGVAEGDVGKRSVEIVGEAHDMNYKKVMRYLRLNSLVPELLDIGTVLGIIAGFKGGILDAIIMRSTEVTMAVPTMTLGVVIMAIFGTSIINLLIVMVISYWMNFARVARNEVIAIRGREFVQASRALGATNSHIMFTQILPNVTTSLIICTSNCFGSVILTESTLSYLYLGVQLPTASWGNMIAAGKDFMAVAPWTVIVPGVALMMAVMGFNFLGDGLRDVLDPKQTR